MKILIVEDNARLRTLMADGLTIAGFGVEQAADAAMAAELLRQTRPDLLILDLGLPDADGLSLLRHLRAAGDGLPVLVVTARGAVEERISGLNQGADDYLVKPFVMAELVARTHAILRRPENYREQCLRLGNVTLDMRHPGAEVAGTPLPLGRREYALLELLMRRAGRTVPRGAIESALYTAEEAVTPNAIEAAISRLRRQLGAAGADIDIHTVRGVGYLLVSP
jgi:DNA-binding response OmpR family regulator